MQARIPGFLLHPGSPSFPCEGGRVRATSIPLRMSPLSSNGVGTTSSVPAPLLLENGGGRKSLSEAPPSSPPQPLLPKGFHPYRIPHGGYTGEDEAGFGNWATLSKTCWKAEGNDWSKQGKWAMQGNRFQSFCPWDTFHSTPDAQERFFFGKDTMLEEVRIFGNSGNRDAMRTIILFKIKKIDVIRLG